MKNKFMKNLFQVVSTGISVVLCDLIIIIPLLFVDIEPEDSIYVFITGYGTVIGLTSLFFLIGFYWIFQWIEINQTGIQIFFLRKKIKEIQWKEVEAIEKTGYMRNPAIRFTIKNQKNFYLDTRKSIVKAMQYYAPHIGEKLVNFQFEK